MHEDIWPPASGPQLCSGATRELWRRGLEGLGSRHARLRIAKALDQKIGGIFDEV